MKNNDSLNPEGGARKPPLTEIIRRAKRRRFSAGHKLRILEEADGYATREDVGALLRRKGFYFSHLTQWHHQLSRGTLFGTTQAGKELAAKDQEIQRLKKELSQTRRELNKANTIIEVQKKSQCCLAKTTQTKTYR